MFDCHHPSIRKSTNLQDRVVHTERGEFVDEADHAATGFG